MIFDSWQGIWRVVLLGTLAYAGLLLMLRVSGKRTLSKMNSFDLVVTIALGSTLSSIILTKSIALIEGLVALALLIALQFIITWLSIRFAWVSRMVKNEPVLLVMNGQMLLGAMRKERVTAEEILQAIRNQQVNSLASVKALVLETDGSMSVLTGSEGGVPSWNDAHVVS